MNNATAIERIEKKAFANFSILFFKVIQR